MSERKRDATQSKKANTGEQKLPAGDGVPEDDTEGHSFLPDSSMNRQLAQRREADIQREIRASQQRKDARSRPR